MQRALRVGLRSVLGLDLPLEIADVHAIIHVVKVGGRGCWWLHVGHYMIDGLEVVFICDLSQVAVWYACLHELHLLLISDRLSRNSLQRIQVVFL